VDFLSNRHPAKSASEKPWSANEEDAEYQRQKSGVCWRIKDVSSTIRKRTDPTPFSPRDSQGSYQSAEQGDYKRSIYLNTLATQTSNYD
jgi:hypothetical protein